MELLERKEMYYDRQKLQLKIRQQPIQLLFVKNFLFSISKSPINIVIVYAQILHLIFMPYDRRFARFGLWRLPPSEDSCLSE